MNLQLKINIMRTAAPGFVSFTLMKRKILMLTILPDGDGRKSLNFISIPHEVDYTEADLAAPGQTPRSGRD